jgi:amino acid transporter
VTVIYIVVNLAYVAILGLDAVRQSEIPAAASVEAMAGPAAARLVSVLVMLSALGAINGTILTGAHVQRELGRDVSCLAWLSRSTSSAGTPVLALLAQSAVALLLVVGVGTATGQQAVDALLTAIGLSAVPWDRYSGGFETLVASAAPLFWVFLLLTGTTVFVLRRRDPERPRPFRIPGYPFTPLAFCAASAYMLWKSLAYAQGLSLVALVPIFSAAAISRIESRRTRV